MSLPSLQFDYKPRAKHIIANFLTGSLIVLLSSQLLRTLHQPLVFSSSDGPVVVLPVWFLQTLTGMLGLIGLWFLYRFIHGLIVHWQGSSITLNATSLHLPRDLYASSQTTLLLTDINEISDIDSWYAKYRIFLDEEETIDIIKSMFNTTRDCEDFEQALMKRLEAAYADLSD
jgi:hypothetical protein